LHSADVSFAPPNALEGLMALSVSITVNGRRCDRDIEPRLLLVHFLRDTLGL